MNNEKKFSKHSSPTGALKACVESLSSVQTALLIRLYHMQTLATDKLPYTPEFRKLVKTFQNEYGKDYKERMLFDALIGLRKNKKLVRKVAARKKVTESGAAWRSRTKCRNCWVIY